jgi:uncharacterized membrane protein YdjX (TVP38/TMEM64 family)
LTSLQSALSSSHECRISQQSEIYYPDALFSSGRAGAKARLEYSRNQVYDWKCKIFQKNQVCEKMKLYGIDLNIWIPRAALAGAALAVYILLVWVGWLPLNPFEWLFALGEQLRSELPKYGPLAPLVYITLYALQIVIAPLPGAALAYTAGYLFGALPAALYSITAILIGSALGFLLARRFGMPLIEKLAPKSWMERWHNLSAVNSSFTWFLLMLAPTADIFYFIAGLTRLTFRRFMLIVLLGRLPGILLSSYLGDNIERFGAQWIFVLIGAMLLIALAGNWLRRRIEKRALTAVQSLEPEPVSLPDG